MAFLILYKAVSKIGCTLTLDLMVDKMLFGRLQLIRIMKTTSQFKQTSVEFTSDFVI